MLLPRRPLDPTSNRRLRPFAHVEESHASRAAVLLEDLALLTSRRFGEHLVVEVEHLQLLFGRVLDASCSTAPLLHLLCIALRLPLDSATVLLGLAFGLRLRERRTFLLRLALELRAVLPVHEQRGTHSHAIGASAHAKGERE
eukprot:1771543-Prymnesium_polylepis.2